MLAPIYYKNRAGIFASKDYDKAIETFTKIKDTYLNSLEAQEADKYMNRQNCKVEGKNKFLDKHGNRIS